MNENKEVSAPATAPTAVASAPTPKKAAAPAPAPVDDLADAEKEALAAGAVAYRIGNALRVDN